MKVIEIIAVLSFAASCQGAPFSSRAVFGVRAGGKVEHEETAQEEYERAQKAILDAVTRVENKVQDLIEAEVETLFPHGDEHKEGVSQSNKKVVRKASEKVKARVQDTPYHDAFPETKQKGRTTGHRDNRILNAVEAAEKAVLHAIEQEVDSLFHGADPRSNDKGFVPDASSSTSAQSAASSSHDHSDRHNFFLDKKSVSKAKETIKEGVKKAHETVDETQEKRREFLAKETEAALEDYADFTGW